MSFNPKDFAGKKPVSFVLNNEKVNVKTFAELTTKLFNKLYSINHEIFESLAEEKFRHKGKSPLIAYEDWDMNRSIKLENTNINIEMHHSTVSMLTMVYSVLERYGLLEKFSIEVE